MDYYNTDLARQIEWLKGDYSMQITPIVKQIQYIYERYPISTTAIWNPEECTFELKVTEPEECIRLKKRMQEIWDNDYEPRLKDLIDKYGKRSSR